MPYLSRILNSKVRDTADVVVGRIKDVLIKPAAGKYSPLQFLAIKAKKGGVIYLPFEAVDNFSHEEVSLKLLFNKTGAVAQFPDGLVCLKRDILDQQIVDLSGARVVRVNDLRIGDFQGATCVLGIDVSFKGLLRRLGVSSLDFLDFFKVNFIDWRQTQPVKGFLKLNVVSNDLSRLHPADLANIVENLNVKNAQKLVASLDAEAAAKVFEEMDAEMKKALVRQLPPDQMAEILDKMSMNDVVDFVKQLSEQERNVILSHLKMGTIEKIRELIEYSNDTAGGLMTTDFMKVEPAMNVNDVVAEIKRLSPALRSLLYVYVVSPKDGKYIGSVSLRRILIASPTQKIGKLIKRYAHQATLNPNDSIKEIIRLMTKYDLNMVAVVESTNVMVGVITIDDVMRYLAPKA
ncbi:MAG: CBS domain-containing protein [Patescibacteria group bacterium]